MNRFENHIFFWLPLMMQVINSLMLFSLVNISVYIVKQRKMLENVVTISVSIFKKIFDSNNNIIHLYYAIAK